MKRFVAFLLATACGGASAANAQESTQVFSLKIWDNSTAPHSNGIATPETAPAPGRIGNTSEAELFVYPAVPAKHTGLAVVICPGGGYTRLAMEHEGHAVAEWLAANGITAAVLKYRMPAGHPEVPLEDAEQALRIMKGTEAGAGQHAAPKVGIIGFSAGGHLAAMTSTMAETKPDFAILFYPVITAVRAPAHGGTFKNLLGTGRNAASEARYSLENRVNDATPPTLLLLSDDDRSVPPVNSTCYYEALKRHGIEGSIHLYPTGGHGWGFRDSFSYKPQWQAAVLDWLERLQAKNEK